MARILNGFFTRTFSTLKHFSKTLPEIKLNIEYLCDSLNLNEIAENISQRKGVGNIYNVQELYKKLIEINCSEYQIEDLNGLKERFLEEIKKVPNKTHPDVFNYGDELKVIRICGDKPMFDYKIQEFSDITKALNLIRTEHLGTLTGHRSYYLLGELAKLEKALIKYTMSKLIKHNFQIISVPDTLPGEVIERCGMNTVGERTQVYMLDSSKHGLNQCLSGTAEMALAGLLINNIIPIEKLPLKLAAVSRCYRAETSNLAEEKGIYRVHQFTKVEMFGVSEPGKSALLLEEFLKIQEENFSLLGLHTQTLDMPPHELGASAYRKYDIEAWLPARKMFGEISSCSDCTDYQARRLNIKYNSSNHIDYVFTVNGTACAIPRMLIAIIETYQQKNGTILIPEVLRQFMDNKKYITKQKHIPQLKLIKS